MASHAKKMRKSLTQFVHTTADERVRASMQIIRDIKNDLEDAIMENPELEGDPNEADIVKQFLNKEKEARDKETKAKEMNDDISKVNLNNDTAAMDPLQFIGNIKFEEKKKIELLGTLSKDIIDEDELQKKIEEDKIKPANIKNADNRNSTKKMEKYMTNGQLLSRKYFGNIIKNTSLSILNRAKMYENKNGQVNNEVKVEQNTNITSNNKNGENFVLADKDVEKVQETSSKNTNKNQKGPINVDLSQFMKGPQKK